MTTLELAAPRTYTTSARFTILAPVHDGIAEVIATNVPLAATLRILITDRALTLPEALRLARLANEHGTATLVA